eukprot:479697_1
MSRVISVFMLLALVLSVDSRHSRMLLSCDKLTCDSNDECANVDFGIIDVNAVCSGSGYAVECNGKRSCKKAQMDIRSNGHDIEYVKCNNDDACNGAKIEIDCGGNSMKGVSCNGLRACQDAEFTINDCEILEKFECNGVNGCFDANIEFTGTTTLGEFVCDTGSSNVCAGSFYCHSESNSDSSEECP